MGVSLPRNRPIASPPMGISTRGRISASSASSHGAQSACSARRGHAIAAAGGMRAGVAAGDRDHGLRGAELGLVEAGLRQPAEQPLARGAGEGPVRHLRLVPARRLAHGHEDRARVQRRDGRRADEVAGVRAAAAGGEGGLESAERWDGWDQEFASALLAT